MGRREKNVLATLIQVEKELEAKKYVGEAVKIRLFDGTPAVCFNPEAIDNPEEKYAPVWAYLNQRYTAGDLTDAFMKVFNMPKTEADVIGKKCYITTEYRGDEDNPYLTVTKIESIK